MNDQEELMLLRSVVVNTNEGVVISTATDETVRSPEIIYINKAFSDITGYSVEELKNKSIHLLRGPKTSMEVIQQMNEKVKKGEPVLTELINYRKDGTEFIIEIDSVPIKNEKGDIKYWISIQRDITESKRQKEELRLAKEAAESSEKAKEEFIANVSHEIRTPMNAISSMTWLLLKSDLNEEQKDMMNTIRYSAENLLVIINDILDISKIKSGKFKLEQTQFTLKEILHVLHNIFIQKANEKKIKLTLSLDPEIPEFLIGDPVRLNQIFINLIGNAFKFTESGFIILRIKLTEKTNDTCVIRFEVEDSGIGIPEDKLSTIFESFTQASSDTTRKYGGTGLGLTIARQLVELQGGLLNVESKVGKGSMFYFNLTFEIGSLVASVTKISVPEISVIKDITVLIIDDNQMNLLVAEKILSQKKIKSISVDSGGKALDFLQNNTVHLILLDLQIPDMDGYQIYTKIRNELKEPKNKIPVIAMSAHARQSEIDKCLALGMNDYVTKPFKPEELYLKIMKYAIAGE